MGGESPSERSTFTYIFSASPREDSGSQARRREAAALDFADVEEEEEEGRESGGGFCCSRAI